MSQQVFQLPAAIIIPFVIGSLPQWQECRLWGETLRIEFLSLNLQAVQYWVNYLTSYRINYTPLFGLFKELMEVMCVKYTSYKRCSINVSFISFCCKSMPFLGGPVSQDLP